MNKYLMLLIILFCLTFITGCSQENIEQPKVRIVLEDGREINIELYPEKAPKTVENFLKLVDEKYYNGVAFHRIIENFMIQTGGYYVEEAKIREKEEVEPIIGEFSENGFATNDILHETGVISMARTSDFNSAASEFFICSTDNPHLDGKYAAFGKTIDDESTKIVIDISKSPTRQINNQFPNFPFPVITIKKIERI